MLLGMRFVHTDAILHTSQHWYLSKSRLFSTCFKPAVLHVVFIFDEKSSAGSHHQATISLSRTCPCIECGPCFGSKYEYARVWVQSGSPIDMFRTLNHVNISDTIAINYNRQGRFC